MKNSGISALCLVPWPAGFLSCGLLFPVQDETVRIAWLAVAFLWGIGHIFELAASIPIGKSKGIPVKTIIIKTIVFGITWWLPLNFGFIKK